MRGRWASLTRWTCSVSSPRRSKHAELAGAWVALAPSIKEGWGLSVVEAASHGVPTVAYAGAGGLSESIVDGRTGRLVASMEEMAREVSRLVDDRAAREQMGEHAREYARQFTWPETVRQWEVLLERIASGEAPAATMDRLATPLSS